MPFLHLDTANQHKEAWRQLVKDHPAGFEVLEWSPEQDKDLIQRSFPQIDTQLYPASCISLLAAFQKLVCYGGINVRGGDVFPIRGLRIRLEDWKTQGPPAKLTVRNYYLHESTIMAAPVGDPICKKYVEKLLENLPQYPQFGDDVATM